MPTEPKYLLSKEELSDLVYALRLKTNFDPDKEFTPYLFKDGWVKCSDQEPEDFKEVLVLSESGQRVCYFRGYLNAWYDYRGEEIYVTKQIPTHWMPLPSQPPKEEKQNKIMDKFDEKMKANKLRVEMNNMIAEDLAKQGFTEEEINDKLQMLDDE